MDDEFKADEKLYRAVEPKDMYYKDDGSLSSAAFKSKNGCSVDRGDNRTDKDAALFMKSQLCGDIYRASVADCNSKSIFIRYEPTENNRYHSGLYKDNALNAMTSSQCKFLSRIAIKVK